MSWWGWATVGLLAYSGVVALVVRACRWSARLSRGEPAPAPDPMPAPDPKPAPRPLAPARSDPGPVA